MKKTKYKDIQKIIKKSSDPKLIESVFDFAKLAYKEKNRISGENYIHHAVRVASMLDKMDLDPFTFFVMIIFGLGLIFIRFQRLSPHNAFSPSKIFYIFDSLY